MLARFLPVVAAGFMLVGCASDPAAWWHLGRAADDMGAGMRRPPLQLQPVVPTYRPSAPLTAPASGFRPRR